MTRPLALRVYDRTSFLYVKGVRRPLIVHLGRRGPKVTHRGWCVLALVAGATIGWFTSGVDWWDLLP